MIALRDNLKTAPGGLTLMLTLLFACYTDGRANVSSLAVEARLGPLIVVRGTLHHWRPMSLPSRRPKGISKHVLRNGGPDIRTSLLSVHDSRQSSRQVFLQQNTGCILVNRQHLNLVLFCSNCQRHLSSADNFTTACLLYYTYSSPSILHPHQNQKWPMTAIGV